MMDRRAWPALMYHDIVPPGAEDSSGFPGRDAARYKVTPERFEEHLRGVINRRCSALPQPVISFDDGGSSALAAAEALERHGLRGYFLLTANYVGRRGFLNEDAVRDLHGRGHVIGSHSCSHPLRMGHCSALQLADEWTRSREAISAIVGEAITVASVPGGDYAPSVAEAAARAGFTLLFTSEPTDRESQAFGLHLRGRFTIYRWTTAWAVGGLVAGDWLPRAQQTLAWNARKITKRIAGERYLQLRKLLLRHDDGVSWGDGPSLGPTATMVETAVTPQTRPGCKFDELRG